MLELVTDRLRFLGAFLAHPRQVGAVLPTSRTAVRAMLDQADVAGAELVVELGAGTGAQTQEILARMKPGARLVTVEIDRKLAALLAERFDDPRVQVVCDSAENLDAHLGTDRADAVVCALPYTSLDQALRQRLLDVLPRVVAPAGVVVAIQYSPLMLPEFRARFADVRWSVTPWNVPPALVFALREPVAR